jgi:hypothetical protein
MNEETVKNTKIKQILVDQIGWIYSSFSDNQVGGSGNEPIEVFTVNGEMAPIVWYKKGNNEFNGKYVIQIVYEK